MGFNCLKATATSRRQFTFYPKYKYEHDSATVTSISTQVRLRFIKNLKDVLCNESKVTKSILPGVWDLEIFPETLKYWVGVQRGQSYLMGRRCLFSLGWPLF